MPSADPEPNDIDCDVLVIGSGSAALTAALTTSAAGLATVIVEKSDTIGGTTVRSGAAMWVPTNDHAAAAGFSDSEDEALAYIAAAAPDGWAATEAPLWRAFVHHAPEMLRFVEARTPLRLKLTNQPDPLDRLVGAKQAGRMLAPLPLARRLAGRWRRHLGAAPLWHLFTFQEMLAADPYRRPVRAVLRHAPRLLLRAAGGRRAQGSALIIGLLRGCLDQRCRILLDTRAERLLVEDGAVRGVSILQSGRRAQVRAHRGVVIATGGFEWDPSRHQQHFPELAGFLASPSTNEGDGQNMVSSIGGKLARMDQANISPGIPTGGSARSALSVYFHQDPSAILVDRSGRRFVDETVFNLGEVLAARNPQTGELLHQPAWCIADIHMLRRARLLPWLARRRPGWIVRARTIEGLSDRIGLPVDALRATVLEYNADCGVRLDRRFGRTPGLRIGMQVIDLRCPIAIPLVATFVSTKGGPRTTARGQVVDMTDQPIPGLFCAGVAMANPIGTRAVGAGTTIGPNMTWGYICGRSLADG